MRLIGTAVVLLFLAIAVEANPVQFDTGTYNFALAGGGGGESGVLDSDLSVETFCDNFNNEIYLGHDYSAYLSTLTTGSDLSHTRFGPNSSWQTVAISGDATDSAIINYADALGRYQMAAFLVSQYRTKQGGNAYNNGIQTAIWDILDPSSSPAAPTYSDAARALEETAQWYASPNSKRSFLADFLIVSDSTMSWRGAGNPQSGGFQEQLAMLTSPAPEPRATVWILIGLFSLFAGQRRPSWRKNRENFAAEMRTFLLGQGTQSDCFHGTYPTAGPEVPVLSAGYRTSTH